MCVEYTLYITALQHWISVEQWIPSYVIIMDLEMDEVLRCKRQL